MRVKSFLRTVFGCSHFDQDIEAKRRQTDAKNERVKRMIANKTERIAEKTKDIEAGAELLALIRKDNTR